MDCTTLHSIETSTVWSSERTTTPALELGRRRQEQQAGLKSVVGTCCSDHLIQVSSRGSHWECCASNQLGVSWLFTMLSPAHACLYTAITNAKWMHW